MGVIFHHLFLGNYIEQKAPQSYFYSGSFPNFSLLCVRQKIIFDQNGSIDYDYGVCIACRQFLLPRIVIRHIKEYNDLNGKKSTNTTEE